MLPKFVKVMPRDYKRMLTNSKKAHDQGLTGEDAIMVAFEENCHDLSRVSGN
jgi:glutamate synthase (ferredoxin)